jgi:hypothetical protein|tara:strand:- start:91 stop:531 length:441 start_codon:yes stop_codon:yes gene_type:complete
MNPDGYNPIRWDCAAEEKCFNVFCRPKIEDFAECFPRAIGMGDLDGFVEYCENFLIMEWKSFDPVKKIFPPMPHGQKTAFLRFSKVPGNIVFIVEGEPQTMQIDCYKVFWKGGESSWRDATLDGLKAALVKWVEWVDEEAKNHGRA